jgi:hypothetical protein
MPCGRGSGSKTIGCLYLSVAGLPRDAAAVSGL